MATSRERDANWGNATRIRPASGQSIREVDALSRKEQCTMGEERTEASWCKHGGVRGGCTWLIPLERCKGDDESGGFV